MNGIVDKLDEWGRPAWITLMVIGFIVFWPIGLAILGYMIWSGRMGKAGCGRFRGWGRRAERAMSFSGSSGNAAFDEYRDDTLRRLEEEQREFTGFLERLRRAKDKVEFDQFMAERRAGARFTEPTADNERRDPGREGGAERSGPTGPVGPVPSPAY
ncbi:MAG: DUF2852 domain-containing protein [Rhizobiales bacterium]|nr:DUF2852 domain-containing protein [Hyphomicrobiales bacterium]